ncbi:hypothetical protein [Lacipirellula sp.]|uniref:hypothetical protein n=1 Tax=Lacipirellula sp. TaxID=2691419 RepID=UPI003D0CB145
MTCSPEEFDGRVDTICAVLCLLIGAYPLAEIRVLKSKGQSLAGYFDSWLEAAKFSAYLDLHGYGGYFCLNPVDPDTYAFIGRYNEVGPGKAITDEGILDRRLLLIDVDPVRPARVCSTDAEKAVAMALAQQIVGDLTLEGWPAPVIADSGNGCHLLYRIELPTDDDGLVQRVLLALDAKYSTQAAKIDTTVFNPSRVCRLYGTRNRKGADTTERPHRETAIVSAPEALQPVPRLLLEKLAATVPPISRQTAAAGGDSKKISATGALSTPVAVDPELFARARAKIGTLPIAIEGQNGSAACFRAACTLVHDFGIPPEIAFPLMKEYGDQCQPPWSDEELRHKLNDAAKKAEQSSGVGSSAPAQQKTLSAAERLMETISARCELWRTTEDNEAYVTIRMPSASPDPGDLAPTAWHQENYPVRSTEFREALRFIDFEAHGKVVSEQALKEAIDTAAAKARVRGKAYDVFLRVARVAGSIYLDLGRDSWDAVAIGADGWKSVDSAPCKFRRAPGMLPLPLPTSGGQMLRLKDLINLESENDLILVAAWLVTILRAKRPYPLLSIYGEQGSAKSTMSRMVRNLIDPHKALIKTLSRNEHDLVISAENSLVVALDNVSHIDDKLSDSLCRLATGVGFSTRKLYTDSDEKIFDVCRPVIINSIGEVITRPDLLERSIVISIPVIPEAGRQTEEEISQRYTALHGEMLGALLNGAVEALRNYQNLKLSTKHRMADFQQWAAAAMPAFGWTAEDFNAAYDENIQAAQDAAMEGNPVVTAIRLLLKIHGGRWPATNQIKGASDLLQELEALPDGPKFKIQAGWPQRGTALGRALVRLSPLMRRSGIHVQTSPRRTAEPRVKPVSITVIVPTSAPIGPTVAQPVVQPCGPTPVSEEATEEIGKQQDAAQSRAQTGVNWEEYFEEYLKLNS